MLETITKTFIATIFVYFITLFFTRLLGRKLIQQMTFFDFVIGIMLGSAAVNSSTIKQNSTASSFTVLLSITILTLIVDFVHLRSIKVRKVLEAEPVIVIEKGQINSQNMKKLRLSIEELLMLLREKNIFILDEVENAIMETDGMLSVQKKSQNLPLTPKDMNIKTPVKSLTRDVVNDGKILEQNLNYINLNEEWLNAQLLQMGINDAKDVFYAGLDSNNHLYVSLKQNKKEKPGQHGLE